MYKKRNEENCQHSPPQNQNPLALCSMQSEIIKWGVIPGIRQNNNSISGKSSPVND